MSPDSLPTWLAYLEKLHPTTIELGLVRAREVLERLFLDFSHSRIIVVGGTNGKGSSVAMIGSILRAAGFSTCSYTSPHLVHYNERVQIHDRLATDGELCEAFEAVEAARKEISLTYFEFGTLAAFWLFAHHKPDFMILEVGLGGRLDAVNLLNADLAIITNVDLDHVDWLGPDVESIGLEKAGIIRAGKPVLFGDTQIPSTVIEYAQQLQSPLLIGGTHYGYKEEPTGWSWWGQDALGTALVLSQLPILHFPLANAASVIQALLLMDLVVPAQINLGLKSANLSGRMQKVTYKGHQILLDVGHNPHAARYLGKQMKSLDKQGVLLVLGMLADKDRKGVVAELAPHAREVFIPALGGERGTGPDFLYECVAALGVSASTYGSVSDAFHAALLYAEELTLEVNENRIAFDKNIERNPVTIVVTGSFLTVGAVLELL
jgi:dihydrofolate synthase/folylpolyglutamate synthase